MNYDMIVLNVDLCFDFDSRLSLGLELGFDLNSHLKWITTLNSDLQCPGVPGARFLEEEKKIVGTQYVFTDATPKTDYIFCIGMITHGLPYVV